MTKLVMAPGDSSHDDPVTSAAVAAIRAGTQTGSVWHTCSIVTQKNNNMRERHILTPQTFQWKPKLNRHVDPDWQPEADPRPADKDSSKLFDFTQSA